VTNLPCRSALTRFASLALLLVAFTGCARQSGPEAPAFEFHDGDRVVYLGDTLIEREQYHGWLDVMFASRFPDHNISFRNLGWAGDTPDGKSRLGRSLLQAGKEPADEGWRQLTSQLADAAPTVVVLGYGMTNSFDGEAGLADFKSNYTQLLTELREISPDVRFVFLGPLAHENLGAPWPDPAAHNADLAPSATAIAELAAAHESPFIDLTPLTTGNPKSGIQNPKSAATGAPLTSNGIHLNATGYRHFAESVEDQLFKSAGAWRDSPHAETLHQAVIRKNVAYFNRSRPANMAYIFGFRKREQGNNATEVLEFDQLVAAEDQNIALLRHLQPTDITVPEQRLTNRVLEFTPQARPNFEVADGFEVTLWAENPLINKPIHMNWDAQGRLWIAASTVYPQIEPGQAPADRILVLADTNADGTADQVTTFADGLLIPTGVLPGDDGVYVAQSTELLHFRDTDGDGVADQRRIVLSGFGTEDSHHNLHTPQWGPDGRLYVNQSVYTRTRTETPHGVVDLKAGGIFRFDPRDQKMSIHYRGLINGWGHAFDAHGNSFMSDGAGFSGPSWGITGAIYTTLAPARRTLQTITPGSFPKYAGIEVLHSDLFPADWQGDLITCDFRANRIVRFKLDDDGAGFIGREQPEIIRTVADSFRPIDVKLGPDGALYIADWSNPIIQHGEVDFRDTRRDKVHGRIWRVAPTGHKSTAPTDLTQLSNPKLLDLLLSPTGATKIQARRVLTERGSSSDVGRALRPTPPASPPIQNPNSEFQNSAAALLTDLDTWTANHSADPAQLQALWLRQSLNLPLAPVATNLLASSSGPTRAATIRALSLAAEDDYPTVATFTQDNHSRVRLEAVRALARFPTAASATTALAVLETPMDPYLDYALWLTINELAAPLSESILSNTWPNSDVGRALRPTSPASQPIQNSDSKIQNSAALAFALTALLPEQAAPLLGHLVALYPLPADGSGPWTRLIQDSGGPAELRALFDGVISGEFSPAATTAALNALHEATRLRKTRPTGSLDALIPLLSAPNLTVKNAAIRLAGAWKLSAIVPQLIALAKAPATPESTLRNALDAIRDIGGPATTTTLVGITRDHAANVFARNRAAIVLAAQDLPTHAADVIARLQASPTDAAATQLWRSLLGIKNAGAVLAEKLLASPVSSTVARAGLRPAREGNQNEALVRVLLDQAGLSLSTEKLTGPEMIALAATAEADGHAARGEMIYRQSALACIACHAIGGAGGKVGPDLTSIGASAPTDYIIEALLYPADKVKEGYHATLVTTHDDQAMTGVVIKENAQELVLLNPANQEISVAVANIASRTNIGSLMPAGLIDTLLPQERLDLIKFLSSLGKPGPYDATRSNVARQWQVYLTWSSNRHLGVERVAQGDFTLPDWFTTYSRVDGIVPPVDFQAAFPRHNNPDHLFLAVQFSTPTAGRVTFTQVAGLTQAWLNGTLVPIDETFTLTAQAGANTLVFRTSPKVFPENLRLSSTDVTFLSN